jgi:hypothetical protein
MSPPLASVRSSQNHARCPKPAQVYPAILDFHVVFGAKYDFGALDVEATCNSMGFRVTAVRCVFKAVVQRGEWCCAWPAAAMRDKSDARRKPVDRQLTSNAFDSLPSARKHSICCRIAVNIRASLVTVR